MKTAISLIGLLLLNTLSAQTTTLSLPRLERSFGIAGETGQSLDYVEDMNDMNYLTELGKYPSKGLSLFYEQQLNSSSGWGYSAGIGANITFISWQLKYRNPSWTIWSSQGVDSIHMNADPKTYDYGKANGLFLSLDLPFTLSYSFRITPKFLLRPYSGIKVRNVLYVPDQNRYTWVQHRKLEKTGEEVTFDGQFRERSGAYDSQVMLLATFGLKGSHLLKNGGALNLFADYNMAFMNHFEVHLSNFKSNELIKVYNRFTDETTYVNYGFQIPYSIYLGLKMSHFRFGMSYSFPSRKDKAN